MMFQLQPFDIVSVCQAERFGNYDSVITSVCIDSRHFLPVQNCLFVAICGLRHNGHDYIDELYAKGVKHFLVDKPNDLHHYADANIYLVSDCISALQKIAFFQRVCFNGTTVSITGSNGKTVVKEWIYFLIHQHFNTCKSPRSYNSQIGVPLSLLELVPQTEVAVFEAGISQPGEMAKLAELLQPNIGVFTNLGNAHQQYFDTYEQKMNEKLLLFKSCTSIIYCSDDSRVPNAMDVRFADKKHLSWSLNGNPAHFVVSTDIDSISQSTRIEIDGTSFTIPFIDNASIENAINAFLVVQELHFPIQTLITKMSGLPRVEMRLSFVEGVNNTTLINDCYTSDLESIRVAIQTLGEQSVDKSKVAVLSDFEHAEKKNALEEIFTQLENIGLCRLHFISHNKYILPKVGFSIIQHRSTDEFLSKLSFHEFSDSYVLIKGSRHFEFEKVVKRLEKLTHQTVLEVNLSAISNNLNVLKSNLLQETKVMAMVKGFSYGSGDYEIAEHLRLHKVDYLAVAFVDEGIVLRQKGIDLPIAVMNPEVENYAVMLDYDLEPEIYSISSLQRLINETRFHSHSSQIKIHVKIDTGMKRLGLEIEDLEAFMSILRQEKNIRVQSVFSHLCAADSAQFDDFTALQFQRFNHALSIINETVKYTYLRHILNSAGTQRFPEYQYNMVRLGIGLYGISSLESCKLEHISTLRSIISQIRNVKQGESVGYSRNYIAEKDMQIGILPIGYADGYDRRFSNGVGQVLVNGVLAPIVGNVCMDACMIDLNGIKARENDAAVIFSSSHTIRDLAEQIGTIPYEILTNISKRVKRVYYKE